MSTDRNRNSKKNARHSRRREETGVAMVSIGTTPIATPNATTKNPPLGNAAAERALNVVQNLEALTETACREASTNRKNNSLESLSNNTAPQSSAESRPTATASPSPSENETAELIRGLQSQITTLTKEIESYRDKVAESTSNESTLSAMFDRRLDELIEHGKSIAKEREQIEFLRSQLQEAIETAEARIAASNELPQQDKTDELEQELIDLRQENVRVSNMLINAREEYHSLVEFIEAERDDADPDHSASAASTVRENELTLEVKQLHEQLEFLQSELLLLRSDTSISSTHDSELRVQIEQLRSQLLDSRHEAVELRLQCNDLSAKIARYQGPTEGERAEGLTWEERKELLMQQLDAETRSDTPCDPRRVLDIEHIINQTNTEIEKRDREIANLQALLSQQSVSRDGIAVGAAAFAEVIESDAIIISERLRLKELQAEWEEKQRQAEIEMSMERAKLARERLELQEKLREFEGDRKLEATANDAAEPASKTSKGSARGRWLARLGLRDE